MSWLNAYHVVLYQFNYPFQFQNYFWYHYVNSTPLDHTGYPEQQQRQGGSVPRQSSTMDRHLNKKNYPRNNIKNEFVLDHTNNYITYFWLYTSYKYLILLYKDNNIKITLFNNNKYEWYFSGLWLKCFKATNLKIPIFYDI